MCAHNWFMFTSCVFTVFKGRQNLYTEFGMPSSHAQFMWFFVTYIIFFIWIRWELLSISVCGSFSQSLSVSLALCLCFSIFFTLCLCLSLCLSLSHSVTLCLCLPVAPSLSVSLSLSLASFFFSDIYFWALERQELAE